MLLQNTLAVDGERETNPPLIKIVTDRQPGLIQYEPLSMEFVGISGIVAHVQKIRRTSSHPHTSVLETSATRGLHCVYLSLAPRPFFVADLGTKIGNETARSV